MGAIPSTRDNRGLGLPDPGGREPREKESGKGPGALVTANLTGRLLEPHQGQCGSMNSKKLT